MQWSELSYYFWCVCIGRYEPLSGARLISYFTLACCIYQIHYLGREENDVSSLMPMYLFLFSTADALIFCIYLICCWFIPLVIALVPLYEGYYGAADYNWCWVKGIGVFTAML